jgi:glycosyltransferase involved in cell wall biosynthesis
LPTIVTMHSMIGGIGSLFRLVEPVVGWRRWPVEWTAVSQTAADDLARRLREDRAVTVLHNAIDVERWRGDAPAPHDGVHIVAVMRLARRKRPLPLLRMLRSVRASVPSDVCLRATIVGDGPSRPDMERYLAADDLGSWVELAGRRDHDEIRALYRTADLFVAPAIQESFGIAALEARAAGLPIVAMAQSGISEFIDHGRSGLLVPTDQEMARAITQLATDAGLRAAIAEHNRLTTPPFGWDRAIEATARVYEAATWQQMIRSLTANPRPAVRVGVA